jgi:hypothetical protein
MARKGGTIRTMRAKLLISLGFSVPFLVLKIGTRTGQLSGQPKALNRLSLFLSRICPVFFDRNRDRKIELYQYVTSCCPVCPVFLRYKGFI